MNKKCTKCGITKESTEFYKGKQYKDGLCYWCKICIREPARLYSKKHMKKEKLRKTKWQKENRKAAKLSREEWNRKNPEKVIAKQKINNAIQSGHLTRQTCIKCNNPKSQGHHPDYSKPLEVIWLCAKHHKELHRKD